MRTTGEGHAIGRRVAIVGALGVGIAPARAQTSWPNKPIRLVVPYPPGGATDSSTRIVAERAGAILGQPILIDNTGGAAGAIGAEIVKHAPADGYTLLTTTTSMQTIQPQLTKLPYDPEADFAPVALMTTSWGALAVHPALPFKSVPELVEYAKANPGKLHFGSSGTGAITHIYGEIFKAEAKIDIVHVPYRGSAPALQDLLAGQIQMQFDQIVLPQVKSGRLRGLAMMNTTRWPGAPEIPSVNEFGYGREGGSSWFGIVAPAGTPPAIVEKLSRAIGEAMRQPDVAAKLDETGLMATYKDPAAFAAHIASERRVFGDVICRANIRLE